MNGNMNDFIEVTIKKPLYIYESVPRVRVNAKYIRQASKEMKLLKIKCLKNTHYATAEEIKNGWKKVKEVFLFPDKPMEMFEGYVTPNLPPERPEVNMDSYLDNMCKLGKIYRKILKRGKINCSRN
jgi:hypothetical protein